MLSGSSEPVPPRPATAAPTGWHSYPSPPEPSVPLVRRRVSSRQLKNDREVVVALPPSYDGTDARFPVVYMQDGQNLFDPATSYAGAWHLGATLANLARQGTEAIVVGIANAGAKRIYEYSPFPDPGRGGGGGDRYLAFLLETVKPMIDADFRTRLGPNDTTIAGSSMGGLISLYALFRFPEIFGAAGVMSPAIWFARRTILRYIEARGQVPIERIYLDIGLKEPARAVADVRLLRDLLAAMGRGSADALDYVEEEGAAHDETAWGRRFSRALPFLLDR